MVRKSLILVFVTAFALACATSDTAPNDNRKTKRGATIGAVAGAIGRRMDKQEEELRQIEGVEVTRPSEGEIDVRLTSDILFDLNSAALRPSSRSTLDDLSSNFAKYPDNRIVVEGHTDSSGTDAYNQRLSEQRAATVADYLIERGVPSGNVIVYGYGEMRPKSSNDTPEGRQLNRRVEIHIQAPQQASTQ
jgi:outer membrane protein OmpA-like peptidoglycan-associated protein